ncbi:MA3 domain-containing protein/MIF4G domain-containing protein [Cephalotus follicularis]|uniref:Eukaryotic translation initiation factor 4G n=1 Tax=Cephalotus follicularis TaxID=3775 RepID=A0A1Q3BUF4_CEPFO|nr:MA3 domain-containing protein/MIF4G domain-containing protein [Cephalotus follicularis]
MSFNQSRPDKSESQNRKSGRSASFNQQRTSSAAYGGKGAGAGPAPSPSLSSNRSFNKKSNNAQGGQSRVTTPPVANPLESAPRNLQNGAHAQSQLHGASDAPFVSAVAKPSESTATQRGTRAVPKAPTPQSAAVSSDNTAPTTPVKTPGDVSKGFALQFGSISSSLMQIPARTSSAPPNLDEQKRDQACHDSFRPVPNLPTPSASKQQLARKDAGTADQFNAGEAHPSLKAKKETQALLAPTVNQTQKPVLPIPITSMQMQYHQPQVPFGGPNAPIQTQGVTATSLQMPMQMPLTIGNAPQVQQPMFVHPLQPQGIMHQSQSLGFTAQMGPPQLVGMTAQYPQQQGGNFGGPRKNTIKITYPDTHEELRLDKRTDAYSDGGSTVPRSHPNMPQSQQIPSFGPPHSINYYPNSYNHGSVYFSAPNSLSLPGGQVTQNSQAPRFNYPVSQGPQNVAFMNSSAVNSLPVNKTTTSNVEHARDAHNVISSAMVGPTQVTVKLAAGSIGEKAVESSLSNSSAAFEKVGSSITVRPYGESGVSHLHRNSETSPQSSSQLPKTGSEALASKSLPQSAAVSAAVSVESQASSYLPSASAALSEESVPVATNSEGRRKETLSRSNSIKDHQKKSVKKGHVQPQNQVGGQSSSTSMLASQIAEHGISTNSGVSEAVEAKASLLPSVIHEVLMESTRGSLSNVCAPTLHASEANVDSTREGFACGSSEIYNANIGVDASDSVRLDKLDDLSSPNEQKSEILGTEEGEIKSPERLKQHDKSSTESATSKLTVLDKQTEQQESVSKEIIIGTEVPTLESALGVMDEPVSCFIAVDKISANMDVSTTMDSTDAESSGDRASPLDSSLRRSVSMVSNKVSVTKSGISGQKSAHVPASNLSQATVELDREQDREGVDSTGGRLFSVPVSGSKDKPTVEMHRTKSTTKGKRNLKEILQKKDAEGTTSDLYNAYKRPEEKKETFVSSEITESTSTVNSNQTAAEALLIDDLVSEFGVQNKAELDDWEDVADISTLKLEALENGKNGNENMAKKYSRDFLLKFAEQCTDLPEGFEISSDIGDILRSANANVSHLGDRDLHSSPGRAVDRTAVGSRIDRRGSGVLDDDRWNKVPGPFGPVREMRLDSGYGVNAGFRPGQVGNYGVLRNPRAQSPVQYVGGILSGPMQSIGSQGGLQRNNSDADRWQRASNFQLKGLIPSPQTPLQMMHKAEKKYEVGKVTDEEQAKQRQLKAILNKLTPQNFEKLFEQVKAVNIDNAGTLTGVISQIFDKALMEPTFCEMYANFCYYLAGELPDFSEDNEKITFKRLLLNKCQEEFERGEREQEEANKADEEGEIKQSEEEREEKRVKARRRMLGNIRLIGELYKKKMLTERIMHECIKKLLGQYQNPDEEDVESLCKLMSTIGEMIDHPKAKEHMDAYFDMMANLSNNMKLSSRVRFMLKDSIDLRKNKWQQRRKVEGPKKIEEVHRDAAQERQAQVGRLPRNSSMNPSPRRAPMDFNQRGSMLTSPNAQLGNFRGLPPQLRGFGTQDIRFEERQSYEARTLSVPLPQRPVGEDSITLGPQGGLARGMSIRGPPTTSSSALADIPPNPGESRRMAAGLNGFGTISERSTYGPREDPIPRYVPDRFPVPAAYDQLSVQDRSINYVNRDPRNPASSFDRPLPTSPPTRLQGPPASTQNVPPEKVWPEERLRDMSMAAIKEFYSARDEKEVALCIKDLNSPGFHPSMISLWVIDSFERKDMERDLLAALLVNLTRSRDGVLSQGQLIKGFESVLTTLEDAVNDAPKAAEFLGQIFAKAVLDNVIPMREIGRLVYEGGEEPGHLLEIGLAGDVLGSTLEMIKLEKGETVLNEIRTSSNLRLEDFRPPNPNRSRILENFI